jgi:benzoate membrane transport protein
VFGLLSPAVARVMLGTPRAFIAALAGLAMLRVLQSAFAIAVPGAPTRWALSSPSSCTVADVAIVGIGAPFWGLVLGAGVAALLERGGPTT